MQKLIETGEGMFKITLNKEQIKFAKLVQKIAATPDGQEMFAKLKQSYIDVPLFNTDPMVMASLVAQAELVKGLLKYATKLDVEKIEELSVITDVQVQRDFE